MALGGFLRGIKAPTEVLVEESSARYQEPKPNSLEMRERDLTAGTVCKNSDFIAFKLLFLMDLPF